MLSESARMSSAAEARFRVQAPNSTPRATKVVALDAAGEAVVRRLARGGWEDATFFTARSHGDYGDTALRDLAGRVRSVADEVDAADLVVLVAGPGGHAQAVSPIGQACSLRRVMTTGFLVGVTSASESELSKTLAQLRPWSLMVVIASSDDYIDDVMTALRA
jgi:predicted alpha/beta hydrolase